MRIARIASWTHKWLTLIVGVQIVFWVVSGLFFTLIPIEQIRSEHVVRAVAPAPLEAETLGELGALRGPQGEAPTKLTIERRDGRLIALAAFAEAAPALYDAQTLELLSPLSEEAAVAAARAHVTLESPPTGVRRVVEASPEYGGPLPAYRVQFKEAGLAVYVAENTGEAQARRSDMWRIYDTLWALHIMDWRDHEDFNHPLIIATTALTLIAVLAGVALFPYRLVRRGGRVRPRP